MQYYNPEIECADRETLRKIQSERLVKIVHSCYENVPLYKKRFDEMGLLPGDIRGIEDITKLPFTTKTDLRDTYPFGLFAVPREELARIHASSGTTGKQTVVGYTKNDVKVWATCAARSIVGIGGTKDDFVPRLLRLTACSPAASACTTAPRSSARRRSPYPPATRRGRCRSCWTTARTSSAARRRTRCTSARPCATRAIDPKSLRLRAGIFGAEPWTEEMRREIERLLAIKAYDIYGLSEIAGPGVSCECVEQNGMHINEDTLR